MPFNDDDYAEVVDSIETRDILDAVDKVDEVRGYFGDGPNGEPPEIRTKLLRLHEMGMDFVNRGRKSKAREFFDLNEELAAELFQAHEAIEAAWQILENIGDQYPESLDDEQEDEDGD